MEALFNDDSNLSRVSTDDASSVTSEPQQSTTASSPVVPSPNKRRRNTTAPAVSEDNALKISLKETCRKEFDIPLAPVFYPTLEEFKDTLVYINKIRHLAEPFGICKIVPPAEWSPPCQIDMASPKRFATKLQQINTLQEGQGFDDGRQYTLEGYRRMAEGFSQTWRETHYGGEGASAVSEEQLARDYWDMVETSNRAAAVEYGNDLDTKTFMSGFVSGGGKAQVKSEKGAGNDVGADGKLTSKYYAKSGWNLNNIPTADGSVLRYLQTPVNGVNVPWLYLGMLFSSFCWHNEDNYFYSINYSHFGSGKQWYGVPGDQAEKFEKVSKDFLMGLFRESPDLLHHMTTQISPSLLVANGISVCKVVQEPRTFIVTFPKSFHCGFSYGFNCGEAVNFATSDWLRAGGEAEERYRGFGRESVFSHQRLLFTLLEHQETVFKHGRKDLATEVLRVLDEELESRPFLFGQGVRDLSSLVNLPPNNFQLIDSNAANYDDMRACCVCKHICIFSAVACECNKTRVSCTRHYTAMCKCPREKKFLLAWESTADLRARRAESIISPEPVRRKRTTSQRHALPSATANGTTAGDSSGTSASRTSKRRITKTTPFDFQFSHNEEMLLIQQAMRLSKKETHRVVHEASDAPVFRPTSEEFKDPLAYIA
eukprot:gene21348-27378_t